jgi:hypothetical protein
MAEKKTKSGPIGPCMRALDKIDFVLAASRIAVGVTQIEPLLDDLLDFIWMHVECEAMFIERFIVLLDELPAGAELLLGYCLYELRWDGVREHIMTRATTPRDREHAAYQRILAAFEDDWRQRVLFLRYNPSRDE